MIIDKLKVNNTEVEYFSFGHGGRALIILPGIGVQRIALSANTVYSEYKIFENDYTVYVFDRRDGLDEGSSIEQFADDTAAAMDALNIDSACVFGASMGGMIAQFLAIKYPEKVHALILGSTLSRPNATAKGVISQWIELAERHDIAALTQSMVPKLYTPELAQRLIEAADLLFGSVTNSDLDRFVIQARAIDGFDVYDKLSLITCPALVIGVEGDAVVGGGASREIAEKVPCELYMYSSEYAHCAFDEAKDYQQRMRSWFDSKLD